jgi:DNA-binding transcriptional LysR family regulator
MLERMQIFIKVIEKKGFRKAAKDLGISTPVVTKRINALEKELAVKLIQRSTRTLAITEAGQLFYDHSKAILNTMETAKIAVKSLKDEVSGTIKIGLPHAINHLYFTPALPKFLKKYPQINIEITQGNHLLSILDKRFDLIMHCGELPDSSFHYKKLGEWKKVTCASPAYFRKLSKPKSPTDLEEHNCLDHADNLKHTWQYQVDRKSHHQLISGNIRVNNSNDLKQLALASSGVVYLPNFIVWKELENKSLIHVLEKHEPKPLGMYLIYPSKQFISKKSQLMIDFISAILNPYLKST